MDGNQQGLHQNLKLISNIVCNIRPNGVYTGGTMRIDQTRRTEWLNLVMQFLPQRTPYFTTEMAYKQATELQEAADKRAGVANAVSELLKLSNAAIEYRNAEVANELKRAELAASNYLSPGHTRAAARCKVAQAALDVVLTELNGASWYEPNGTKEDS